MNNAMWIQLLAVIATILSTGVGLSVKLGRMEEKIVALERILEEQIAPIRERVGKVEDRVLELLRERRA